MLRAAKRVFGGAGSPPALGPIPTPPAADVADVETRRGEPRAHVLDRHSSARGVGMDRPQREGRPSGDRAHGSGARPRALLAPRDLVVVRASWSDRGIAVGEVALPGSALDLAS